MNGIDMTRDEEHLRLLSIFHYVVAGLTAFFSLFPVIHLIIGLAMATGAMPSDGDERLAAAMGWVFVFFASVVIFMGMGIALMILLGGRAIGRRRHYTFCLVVAAVSCLVMPFGTVLGVFTIVVLMRDSVRQLFGREAPGPPAS